MKNIIFIKKSLKLSALVILIIGLTGCPRGEDGQVPGKCPPDCTFI